MQNDVRLSYDEPNIFIKKVDDIRYTMGDDAKADGANEQADSRE